MRIAFIGAGRLAQTLARAFFQAGFDVVAVSSRSLTSAQTIAKQINCQVFSSAQDAVDAAQLVFITVPDDTIPVVAQQIAWRQDHCVVHCSGATEVLALSSASACGAEIGGFHPLQLFADPAVALNHMVGSSVAIEASGRLDTELRRLAKGVGYRVIELPPGVRGIYHAATNYAASFVLSLLGEACDLWRSFGINEENALAALLPLTRGTVEAAVAAGLPGALAGPFSRGDAKVVAIHLQNLSAIGDVHVQLYRNLSMRQLALARRRGNLSDEVLAQLTAAINPNTKTSM